MLFQHKMILIIDEALLDEQMIDYFAKFDFKTLQYSSLSDINNQEELPAAILIHWSIIKNDLSIVNKLYHQYPVPLIVINDEIDEDICVRVLEAGADDYLIKPIHPRELHARISAITRRVQRSTIETEHQDKEVLVFANWRLYPASRQVFDSSTTEELPLSAGEYSLLLAFVRQPHRVLGREFLLQVTKNTDLNPFDRRIDVQISRLRQKIETDSKKPALIKTIRNGGYLFTARVLTVKDGSQTTI